MRLQSHDILELVQHAVGAKGVGEPLIFTEESGKDIISKFILELDFGGCISVFLEVTQGRETACAKVVNVQKYICEHQPYTFTFPLEIIFC